MYRIVIECRVPPFALHGLKEDLASYCEKYGDCRVVAIEEVENRNFYQMSIQEAGGGRCGKS